MCVVGGLFLYERRQPLQPKRALPEARSTGLISRRFFECFPSKGNFCVSKPGRYIQAAQSEGVACLFEGDSFDDHSLEKRAANCITESLHDQIESI